MKLKKTSLFSLWIVFLLSNRAAFAQAAGAPRAMTQAVAAAPTTSILAVPAGGMIGSQGPGIATVDLGPISYFKGTSAPGETSQKNAGSFVISTRFAVMVNCPGSSSNSLVNLSVSRLDASTSHALAIDGIDVGSVAQVLAPSMPCGSSGEHRLEMEVPV